MASPAGVAEAHSLAAEATRASSTGHTAGSLHGSAYFKLLDDSAFFAAQALECGRSEDAMFLLTTSFTTYITGAG